MANGNLAFEGEDLLYNGQPLTFLGTENGGGEEPEPSTESTFGLPAETVALLIKNFGSVANFLRLRNQGQV
jgi:hypothetical protein